ncbi:MAG TPA: hypothetical protein VGR49_01345 [Actinomycetota bacterium]|jgi:hypothetical protein|nr:hypothetical protein [Actinomycetota bacterium]
MDRARTRPRIPVPIRIIAWFEIIGGAFAILNGILLLTRGGWLLILPGAVAIFGGWGLLGAKLWAYFTVVGVAAAMVVLASPLLSLGRTTELFTLIVNAVILLVLLSRGSRTWAESLRGNGRAGLRNKQGPP